MFKKISPYISNLNLIEKSELIKVIDLINGDDVIHGARTFASIVDDSNKSSLYRTLYLTLLRMSRIFKNSNSNSIEREFLKKQLSELRKGLSSNNIAPKEDRPLFLSNDGNVDKNLVSGVKMVYFLTLARYPNDEEIRIWLRNFSDGIGFHEFLLGMSASDEAKSMTAAVSGNLLVNLNDGEFVQVVYESLLGRCAKAWEIDCWREKLVNDSMNRIGVVNAVYTSACEIQAELAKSVPHDGSSCLVMGTGSQVSLIDWEYKASALKEHALKRKEKPVANHHRFYIKTEPKLLISALASLYCGGDFIEQFMENITGQDGFLDYCELIIVDADSPDGEYETIKRYLSKFKNINYIRMNHRVGIYDAWNIAAKAARGEYLTNTNLDDLRRKDSLLLQAGVLENLSFVDVVYQDLYYTFNASLSFEEIVEFGLQTTLPIITPHNMLDYNSPHNAPMWRKKLHDEVGFFDARFRSAGDYEFWLRCISAEKRFYKINDPHVVYYQNPKGLSTRPDTRGLAESCEITKAYARKMVPAEIVMPRDNLVDKINVLTGSKLEEDGDRYTLVQSGLRKLAISKKYI